MLESGIDPGTSWFEVEGREPLHRTSILTVVTGVQLPPRTNVIKPFIFRQGAQTEGSGPGVREMLRI